MSEKQDIWMPLFIGDYLRDTTRLNTEQHGAYFLLIMDYWVNGSPPDDDDELATITGLSLSAWRKHKPKLIKLFKVVDGHWHHKRIDEELIKAAENADKYAKRAKKAADSRWNKNANSNASSNATSIPKAMHGDMHADATSPSPSPTEIRNSSEDSNLPSVIPFSSTLKGEICKSLTELGLPPFNAMNPKFLKLIEAEGTGVEEFTATAIEIRQRSPEKFNFDYLISVIAGRRKDAEAMPSTPAAKPKEDLSWRNDDNQIVAKANEMGIGTYGKNRFELLSAIDKKRDQIKQQGEAA